MKNFILIALSVLMLGSAVIAQDTTAVVEDYNNLVFSGGRYDNGFIFSGGYGVNLTGNLWSFTYADFGNYQALSSEIALLFKAPVLDNLYLGLIAGPSADWIGPGEADGIPAISYLVGAVGGIGTYSINDQFGFWGYAKYKDDFNVENNYEASLVGGGGLFYRF